MDANVKTKHKLRISRRTALLVFLFFVVLASSLFYVFMMSGDSSSSLEGVVHVRSESELVSAVDEAVDSTVIILDNDVTLTGSLVISANKNITLTSNRATVFYKLIGAKHESTIIVENKGVLRLGRIVVTHAYDDRGGGVDISPGGTFVMFDGAISGNKAYFGGGGVYNRGTFILSGGKISGNDVYAHPSSRSGGTASYGGGVYNMGVFRMSGGIISGNTAYCAGGVSNDGTFTMSGGVIYNNKAIVDGGVYNAAKGTFNWRGGLVFSNSDVIVLICAISLICIIGFLFLYFKQRENNRKSLVC
ncbi:MAG: hypothetical protein FWD52_06705 [Candidatus Bathyarchaeota archaeon]|nr:hypothetical protein [Candidatus Termiticorpusculum sp.]